MCRPSDNAAPNAKPITITAQNAQLRQNKSGIDADVDGGTQGVRLEIPPLPKSDKTGALAMGAVVVTSQRASVRQAEGMARFTGNAHAVSSGEGQAKFDVTAEELNLSRTAAGAIDTLKTKGRTRLKLDLPPDANAKPLVNTDKNSVSKPNYWEVEANMATVEIAKNTLTFEGNIKGFYRLSANATQTTDYPFSGERAVIVYVPETGDIARDLKFSFEGQDPTKIKDPKQVEIEIPAFKF